MIHISYQLYCSRNFPPLADTLKMVADTGYQEVEGFGALYDDPDDLARMLNSAGVAMTSGHMGVDLLADDSQRAIAIAKTLGMKKVYAPFLMPNERPEGRDGWAAFAARLAELGKPLQDAGLVFGWHNHDFEMVDLGGTTPLDLIAEAGVGLELDLAWVRVGGHDPVEWINRYADQIHTVHVKDIALDGEAQDEDGWADVGHGTMDWAAIKTALDAAGINHYVVEHDNPNDHARFARRSLETIQSW